MKTLILASLLALTAVSGVVAGSAPAAAGTICFQYSDYTSCAVGVGPGPNFHQTVNGDSILGKMLLSALTHH